MMAQLNDHFFKVFYKSFCSSHLRPPNDVCVTSLALLSGCNVSLISTMQQFPVVVAFLSAPNFHDLNISQTFCRLWVVLLLQRKVIESCEARNLIAEFVC